MESNLLFDYIDMDEIPVGVVSVHGGKDVVEFIHQ